MCFVVRKVDHCNGNRVGDGDGDGKERGLDNVAKTRIRQMNDGVRDCMRIRLHE